MQRFRAAMVIVTAGLMTFVIVFTLLEVTRSEAAPVPPVGVPAPLAGTSARATDSLTASLASSTIAIGVPIAGSELLLGDVQSGDRLDVLASLPSPGDGRPVTAVVVRGATVLQPATRTDPLLLEVSAPDGLALAHLVLGGTRLGYIVWSANGGSPPQTQPLDEQAARLLLGLAAPTTQAEPPARPAPTAVEAPPATLTPVPLATSTPASARLGRVGGFLYQVQPGDTWESIAATFGRAVPELKQWNRTSADDDVLVPQTLLFIPES